MAENTPNQGNFKKDGWQGEAHNAQGFRKEEIFKTNQC